MKIVFYIKRLRTVCLSMLLAGTSVAQSQPTDLFLAADGILPQISGGGALLRITPASPVPLSRVEVYHPSFNAFHVDLMPDNHTLVYALSNWGPGLTGVYFYDPTIGISRPYRVRDFFDTTQVTPDQNGELIVADGGRLARIDRQRNILPLHKGSGGLVKFVCDIDTGDFYATGAYGSLFKVPRLGGTPQLVLQMAGRFVCQDFESGDFLLAGSLGIFAFTLRNGQVRPIWPGAWPFPLAGVSGVRLEDHGGDVRILAASPAVHPLLGWPTGVMQLFRVSVAGAVDTLSAWLPFRDQVPPSGFPFELAGPTIPSALYEGSRHLATEWAGTDGTWRVRVSYREHAGKEFVVLPSVSGVRPPVPIGAGRKVLLAPDGVTAGALSGQLHAAFPQGIRGTLDASGDGQVLLDGRSVRGRGLRVWLTALILEQGQPYGIAAAALPVGVTID